VKGFNISLKVYKHIYSYWLNAVKEKRFPVYFIKYEDYCSEVEENLLNTFKFYMGQESLQGTYLEKRIKDVASHESKGKTYDRRLKEE